MNDEKEIHPSYGMLGASRIQSNQNFKLFGSSSGHKNAIKVTLKTCEKNRHLNGNWYYGNKILFEVYLSPAQWAELLMNMNVGDGVPVTIKQILTTRYPDPPEDNVRLLFEKEFQEHSNEIVKKLSSSIIEIKEILNKKSLSKLDREKINKTLNWLIMEIKSNLPYIQNQFNESMDKTVHEAKTEFDAFIIQTLMSLGLEKLKDKIPQLEFNKEENKKLE